MRTLSAIRLALAAAIASSAIPATPGQAQNFPGEGQIYVNPVLNAAQRDGSMRPDSLGSGAATESGGTGLGGPAVHAGSPRNSGREHQSGGHGHGGGGRGGRGR